MARRVTRQEGREQRLDGQRRGGNAQRVDVAPAQRADALAERGSVREQAAAVAQQLLAARREQQPPPGALEQLEPRGSRPAETAPAA
jgi:hypothetical protein